MTDTRLTPQIITLYGTPWCADSLRSRKFLDRQRVEYEYVDIEQDAAAAAFVEKLNRGFRSTPTIVFPGGSVLVEPTNPQLAEKLDLQAQALRPNLQEG